MIEPIDRFGMREPDKDRIGECIQTYAGGKFYILDPRPEEIRVNDIAASLSKLCRFGGHCLRFYSVAEHSVLVSQILEEWGEGPDVQFDGLMHDATEAYVGDVPKPFKGMLIGYKDIERRIARVIEDKFMRPRGSFENPVVKEADNAALRVEANLVMAHVEGWNFPHDVRSTSHAPEILDADHAWVLFMERYLSIDLIRYTLTHTQAAIDKVATERALTPENLSKGGSK